MHACASSSLTGAGASFCAGADIAHMRSMMGATEQQNVDDALLLARCLRTLDELDRPVIARVNGNVFGGGVGLVACADIAIGVADCEVRTDGGAARHRAGGDLSLCRRSDRQSTRAASVPDRGAVRGARSAQHRSAALHCDCRAARCGGRGAGRSPPARRTRGAARREEARASHGAAHAIATCSARRRPSCSRDCE